MKVCSACKTNKVLSEFHTNPRYRLGVTGMCKMCRNAQVRAWEGRSKLLPKPKIAEKVCSTCNILKPVIFFYRSLARLDGYQSRCKECKGNRERLGRMDPERALRVRLRNYGMTISDLYAMIGAQHGLCAICIEPFAKPVIDHDHDTGAVRGLLCARCNNWLAAVECPDYVSRAEAYLVRTKAAPPRFSVNQTWVDQRKRRKAELKARRVA